MAYNRKKIVRWLQSQGFEEDRRAGGHLILTRGQHRITLQAHGPTDMDENVLAHVVRAASAALGVPRQQLKCAWR